MYIPNENKKLFFLYIKQKKLDAYIQVYYKISQFSHYKSTFWVLRKPQFNEMSKGN